MMPFPIRISIHSPKEVHLDKIIAQEKIRSKKSPKNKTAKKKTQLVPLTWRYDIISAWYGLAWENCEFIINDTLQLLGYGIIRYGKTD